MFRRSPWKKRSLRAEAPFRRPRRETPAGGEVAGRSPSPLERLASFRFTYIAFCVFVLLYVFSVRGVEELLALHFRTALEDAVRVDPGAEAVGAQIEERVESLLRDSPWIRIGGVRVDPLVLGADGRTVLYAAGRAPAPAGRPAGRPERTLLPARVQVVVSVPHNSLVANGGPRPLRGLAPHPALRLHARPHAPRGGAPRRVVATRDAPRRARRADRGRARRGARAPRARRARQGVRQRRDPGAARRAREPPGAARRARAARGGAAHRERPGRGPPGGVPRPRGPARRGARRPRAQGRGDARAPEEGEAARSARAARTSSSAAACARSTRTSRSTTTRSGPGGAARRVDEAARRGGDQAPLRRLGDGGGAPQGGRPAGAAHDLRARLRRQRPHLLHARAACAASGCSRSATRTPRRATSST